MARKLRRFLSGGSSPRVRWYLQPMVKAGHVGKRAKFRRKFLSARLKLKYGVHVSEGATSPASLLVKYPVGIEIGEGVVLGERVKTYQGATLGGARIGDWQSRNYPEIGDDTVIFAGAAVVGRG